MRLTKGPGLFYEELRLEQAVENAGRVVLTVQMTWETRSFRLVKELPRGCWDGAIEVDRHGKIWTVVRREDLAHISCLKCQGLLVITSIVRAEGEDGNGKFQWRLAKR